MNKFRTKISQFIQVALLIGFFSFDTLTIVKSVVLLGSTCLLGGKKLKKYIDINLFLLIFFLFFYSVSSIFNTSNKTEFNFQIFCMAPVMYMAGKWLGYNATSSLFFVRAFWLIGLALASLTLIPAYADILDYGFLGKSRSLSVSGYEVETSATVLAGSLIVLVGFSGLAFAPRIMLSKIEVLIVILSFFATLLVAARLGSRTIFLIGFVSLVIGAYVNWKNVIKPKMLIAALFFLVFTYFSFEYISGLLDITKFYQDRLGSEEYGVATAGGRTERWGNSLVLIFENPMGWSIDVNGYSHNLWLDIARNGGLLSFLIALILTFYVAKSFLRSLARNIGDKLFYTATTCLSVSYLSLFMVEPILDGFLYTFASFCCLWGIVQSYRFNMGLR